LYLFDLLFFFKNSFRTSVSEKHPPYSKLVVKLLWYLIPYDDTQRCFDVTATITSCVSKTSCSSFKFEALRSVHEFAVDVHNRLPNN